MLLQAKKSVTYKNLKNLENLFRKIKFGYITYVIIFFLKIFNVVYGDKKIKNIFTAE